MTTRSDGFRSSFPLQQNSRYLPSLKAATVLIAGALAVTTLAGCSSSPPLKHVLLAPANTTVEPPKHSSWQVAQVNVPAYLDSYDINYRASSYVIDQLPNAKWAQRLPAGITALLQSTINSQLQSGRHKPYTVKVDVSTFAPQPSGKVVLSARWQVKDRKTGHVVAQDATVIKQSLPDKKRTPESVGRTMSRAVRKLGHRIVAAAG